MCTSTFDESPGENDVRADHTDVTLWGLPPRRGIRETFGATDGELLAETVEMTFSPLEECTDEDVLKATAVTMADAVDRRLSGLLGLQRESELTPATRAELSDLMGLYERMLLRKAMALQEAVKRGLRGPLEP